MYNKTLHALISRINPKINPTLKIGHSCLVENGDSLQFQHDIELDESLSSYTCTFTVSSDELVVDVAGEINKLVTVAGAVFIPTPSGFRNIGTAMGIQFGVGVGDFTHLSDSSCFWMEENGFAVKTNVLYPMKIDKSGYAGLVGTADKYFPKGLISRRGSIDIEAWNYLDTLIDFGGSSGVLSAGIIINQFDGTDCNDDLITTAEPKLDPAEIAILVPASGDDIELDKNFTVSGTSNCANVKIEASADGTTWVTLAASVAVSAGAFSKADCQLPSADFDPNDEVTIRVSDVDSISSPDTVAIDTLSTITITPAIGNQVAGVAFNVAGTTNLPDGAEVEVFAGATSKGTATVASGAFTKSVTIADPATGVVMKVDDVLNSNAYDTEEIDIESGIIALQFGGSGDEVITFVEKIGTDYYVAGTTKSSTLFGESTGYSAGVRNFLAKLNSSGTKQWVIFGDADSNSGCTRHACYDSSGGKLYWISLIAFGASTNNHTVKKVSLAGSVEATYTFGYAYEYLIDITCDATNVYVCGYMDISGGSGARDCAWGKIPISTFNSITRERLNVGSPTTTAHATQIQVSGDYVYCAVYDYSNKKAFANKALISSTAQAYTNKFDATGARLSEISSGRFILFQPNTNDRKIRMFSTSLTNGSNGLYNQQIDTKTDTDMALEFNGTSFILTYRNSDNTIAVKNTVANADTYTGSASNIFTVANGTLSTVKIKDDVLFGTIDGKIVSSSTDAGGTDGYIYDEG